MTKSRFSWKRQLENMRITIDPSGRGKRNRPSIFAPEIEARNFHVVPLSRVFHRIRRFVESKVQSRE